MTIFIEQPNTQTQTHTNADKHQVVLFFIHHQIQLFYM